MADLSQLRLGTAPDSWGVWFPADPHQVGWQQYLDEVAKAGYLYTELGPQGFLPQDPAQLNDELAARGLTVSGGTVFAGLHKGKEALDKAIEDFGREARLLSAVGANYLVHLPEQYTDMHSGEATEGADLDAEQWQNLVSGTNELGRVIKQEYGVDLVFHPHVDTHVDTQERIERFLTDTDPQYVNLCLDTGHISFCHGDNVQIVERFPERITYVHLKQVDPEVRDRAVAEKPAAVRGGQARGDGRAALRRAGHAAAAGRAGRSSTATSTASSSRTSTRSSRTSRCPSPPAPPATSSPVDSARPGAGPTVADPVSPPDIQKGHVRSDSEHRRHRRRHDRPGPHPPAHPRAERGPGLRGHRRRPGPGEDGGGRPAGRQGAASPART